MPAGPKVNGLQGYEYKGLLRIGRITNSCRSSQNADECANAPTPTPTRPSA